MWNAEFLTAYSLKDVRRCRRWRPALQSPFSRASVSGSLPRFLIDSFTGRHGTPASPVSFLAGLLASSFCVSSSLCDLFCLALACPDQAETSVSKWRGPEQAALDLLGLSGIFWGVTFGKLCIASSRHPANAPSAPVLRRKLAYVGAHLPYGLCVQPNGVASELPGTRDSWSPWSCPSRRHWGSSGSTVCVTPLAFLFDSGRLSTYLYRTVGWISRLHYTHLFL